MVAAVEARSLRQPLQERSRRTLERLLAATERLLRSRRFEDVGVGEIVRAARTSVGAFYARFRDKQALLPELYARYDRDLGRRLASAERRLAARDLEGVAAWIARELLRVFRERTNLMRALALHARTSPDAIDAATRARRKEQTSVFVRALLAHRARIRHADPERAVEQALFFAVSALREKALFAEATHAASLELSDAELVRACARLIVSYLTLEETAP